MRDDDGLRSVRDGGCFCRRPDVKSGLGVLNFMCDRSSIATKCCRHGNPGSDINPCPSGQRIRIFATRVDLPSTCAQFQSLSTPKAHPSILDMTKHANLHQNYYPETQIAPARLPSAETSLLSTPPFSCKAVPCPSYLVPTISSSLDRPLQRAHSVTGLTLVPGQNALPRLRGVKARPPLRASGA